MTMNPYAYGTFVTSMATTCLGIFVLLRDSRRKLYQTFALYSFAIAWWAAFSGFHTIVESTKLALLLGRLEHVGVVFIPIFFTKVVLILTNRIDKEKLWLFSAYLFGLFLFLLLPNPLFVSHVAPVPPLRQVTRGGPLYIFMVIFFYLYILRAHYLLYISYRKSQADEKKKLGYLFWSSVLGYTGGSLAFLYVYDVPHPIFLSYTVFTVPIYALITTYAIIKHHLLGIDVVFKRSLVYSILVASITFLYLVIVWFLERSFQTTIGYRSIPAMVLALLTIAILFQPLKNRIQRFVDLHFFKGTLESLAEEKEELQEEIRRTDQLRIAATLAAGVAHEIKNPLTSIKTFTKYLHEKKNEDGFVEKFQEVVGDELNRMEMLVRNLLDFSKPKPPKFEKIDISKILSQSLNLVAHNLSVRNIFLRCENKDIESEILP